MHALSFPNHYTQPAINKTIGGQNPSAIVPSTVGRKKGRLESKAKSDLDKISSFSGKGNKVKSPKTSGLFDLQSLCSISSIKQIQLMKV